MLLSNWKLTLDPSGTPLVLLGFGDLLAEEIRFPMAMGLEVVNLAGSGTPFLRQTGNVLVTMEFERYATPSSALQQYDKYARRDTLDTLLTFQALTKKPLRLEVNGLADRYWQFANAAVSYVEPTRHLFSQKPRISQKIRITAAGFSRTFI